MFLRTLSDKIVNVPLDPENFKTVSQKNYLEILLKQFHKDPQSIIIVVENADGNIIKTGTLDYSTQKLEKYNHLSKADNGLTGTVIYYIVQTEAKEILKFQLTKPVKLLIAKNKNADRGRFYQIINEFLGKGNYGSVKAGNLAYYFDTNGKLQQTFISPVARKTIKLSTSSNMNYIINEQKAGEKYLGSDFVQASSRENPYGEIRYELLMPKFPTTLDRIIRNGEHSEIKQFSMLLVNVQHRKGNKTLS